MWNNRPYVFSQKFTQRQSRVSRCTARVWKQANTCSDCLSKHQSQWNTQHFSNFTNSNSSVFKGNCHHSIYIFMFCSSMDSQAFSFFNRGHTDFKVRQPLKNLCSSHGLLPESYFQQFESFSSIPSNLKQYLTQMHCSFRSAILEVCWNCKWNNIHLLNKTLLNNHMCYSHSSNRKCLRRPSSIYA